MVWGAISAGGTLELICVEENINAQIYVEMLDCDFFLKWEDDLPEGFIQLSSQRSRDSGLWWLQDSMQGDGFGNKTGFFAILVTT